MKKVVFLFVALFFVSSAFSQVKFGIKTGGNLSSLSKLSVSESGLSMTLIEPDGMGIGYHGGLFANISMGRFIGLQPELLFSMQGGKLKPGKFFTETFGLRDAKATYQLGYISLPLLFELKPVSNFGILVGPQVNYNVTRKVTVSYNGIEETLAGKDLDNEFLPLRKIDAGVTFGLQGKIGENLFIGARYYLGLIDALDPDDAFLGMKLKGFKSNVIQFSLGYAF